MKCGEWYKSSDGTTFVIENTFSNEEGDWVIYYNKETKQRYECLQGAFLLRFRHHKNRHY